MLNVSENVIKISDYSEPIKKKPWAIAFAFPNIGSFF